MFGILTFALSVSIVVNVYDRIYTVPTLVTEIDWTNGIAFRGWLNDISSIGNILETAKTNFDVKSALNYSTRAKEFANILWVKLEIERPSDMEEHFYWTVHLTSFTLHQFISAKGSEEQVQSLDELTVEKAANLTTTIENLVEIVGSVSSTMNPIQQLQEKGVFNQVEESCTNIQLIILGIVT
jgi:hypothetical protein